MLSRTSLYTTWRSGGILARGVKGGGRWFQRTRIRTIRPTQRTRSKGPLESTDYQAKNCLGPRIGIPEQGDITRRSVSPVSKQSDRPANAVSSILSSSGSRHPSLAPVMAAHSETASRWQMWTFLISRLTYGSNPGRFNRARNSMNVAHENTIAPPASATASIPARDGPSGYRAALTKTFVSTTTRLARIGKKELEIGVRQALCGCLGRNRIHGFLQPFPCDSSKALVLLY